MRIAIIDTSTSRAAHISDGLREAGHDDLVLIDPARPILAQLGEAKPKLVLVNLENPMPNGLVDERQIARRRASFL